MEWRARHYVGAALAVLVAGVALSTLPAHAQPVVSGQGLKFTEYYEAPHETQLKSLLEGAQAQQQPDGRWLITEPKCQTFRVTGEGELVVTAPECLYDPGEQTIASAGPLRVQTADGRFTIEGEGFLWQQISSTLLVSNRVHTTLHRELFGPASATATAKQPVTAAGGIEIFSDRFEYAQASGRGIYEGAVRVAGTNLNGTAGRRTLLLPLAEHRLQSLTAEEKVVVDYEKVHATGDQAFYSADTGLIQLKGRPTWRMEGREGSGDALVFDRTNQVFRATGHARLQMPAASMGAASLFSAPGPAPQDTPPPTNQVVEIHCDNYELRTNVAVFRQQVRVSQRLGGQDEGQMTCDRMTLTLTGTNELERMVAEQDVVIAQGDRQFAARRAEYTAASHLLDLAGNPTWRDGSREGKGNSIRANLARAEMLVQGNAQMRLPAAEVGQAALTASGALQPSPEKSDTAGFAEISAREYVLTAEAALFRGEVRIEHPQMKWTCEELTMLSPPELGREGRMIIAEPAVVFDLLDDQGRSYHGTGQKAVYTRRLTAAFTNDLMELTGTPAMLEATNIVIRNKVIALDLSNHKLATPGKYNFRGTLPEKAEGFFSPLE